MYLAHVNVTEGQWHTVRVQRVGKSAIMRLDGGEGRYYNRTEGTLNGHMHIKVARRQFYAGGDVKFPAHNVPAIVDYDYRDSKCDSKTRMLGRLASTTAGWRTRRQKMYKSVFSRVEKNEFSKCSLRD